VARGLTKTYLARLRTEEIRALENIVREKEQRIAQLEQQNEALSRIIHKDNKLIPAMELAVREFLESSAEADGAGLRHTAKRCLANWKSCHGSARYHCRLSVDRQEASQDGRDRR
jgi:hypothetical protein